MNTLIENNTYLKINKLKHIKKIVLGGLNISNLY